MCWGLRFSGHVADSVIVGLQPVALVCMAVGIPLAMAVSSGHVGGAE